MLLIAIAAALSLRQPVIGTYARHPSSTSFRSCSGKLGEAYSHLERLSGSFGYSADFFLGCSDGDHAPWVVVAGIACRANEESQCAGTDQLTNFTSFKDILEPNRDIRYSFHRYSVGEDCRLDHDAGGVWMCRTWSRHEDLRGATLVTTGGDMILDDDWSVDDRTDAQDEDYTLRLGDAPE